MYEKLPGHGTRKQFQEELSFGVRPLGGLMERFYHLVLTANRSTVLVQIPCTERGAVASVKGVHAAGMALHRDDIHVGLDKASGLDVGFSRAGAKATLHPSDACGKLGNSFSSGPWVALFCHPIAVLQPQTGAKQRSRRRP